MAGYIGTQAVSVNTTSATISDDLAVGDDATITGDLAVGSNTVISGNASIGGPTSLLDISTDWSPITSTMFEVFDGTGGSDSPNLMLSVDRNTTTAAGTIGFANRNNSSASTATGQVIAGITGRIITSDSNAGDDSGGELKFYSKPEAGAVLERLHITSGGDVNVKTGNLIIGTAGKGIDFSAATTGTGVTAEILDDYEEGVHNTTTSATSGTPTIASGENLLSYVKIGTVVHINGQLGTFNCNGCGGELFVTMPYTSQSLAERADYYSLNVVKGDAGASVAHFWIQNTGGSATFQVFAALTDGSSNGNVAALMANEGNFDLNINGTYRTT